MGADHAIRSTDGATPLMDAARNGYGVPDVCLQGSFVLGSELWAFAGIVRLLPHLSRLLELMWVYGTFMEELRCTLR